MPFAGYSDFDDCVARNQDKDDPEAYCGAVKAKTEDMSGEHGTPLDLESHRQRRNFQKAQAKTRHPSAHKRKPRTFKKPST